MRGYVEWAQNNLSRRQYMGIFTFLQRWRPLTPGRLCNTRRSRFSILGAFNFGSIVEGCTLGLGVWDPKLHPGSCVNAPAATIDTAWEKAYFFLALPFPFRAAFPFGAAFLASASTGPFVGLAFKPADFRAFSISGSVGLGLLRV